MIDMVLSHTVEVAAFFHLAMMRIVVHHVIANVAKISIKNLTKN